MYRIKGLKYSCPHMQCRQKKYYGVCNIVIHNLSTISFNVSNLLTTSKGVRGDESQTPASVHITHKISKITLKKHISKKSLKITLNYI